MAKIIYQNKLYKGEHIQTKFKVGRKNRKKGNPVFEVKCFKCGHLFTATGMKDTKCPKCRATIYDKDPNCDKWRNVPAIRVVGVKK